MDEVPCYQGLLIYLKIASQDDVIYARWEVYIRGVQIRSDRILSDFGTKIYISDRIDKVVS
jgi:hypothetical protein